MGEERVRELRQKLREPVEIRHGEFKPLGECTPDDLRAAAQFATSELPPSCAVSSGKQLRS